MDQPARIRELGFLKNSTVEVMAAKVFSESR
jgi:hypothetical protein